MTGYVGKRAFDLLISILLLIIFFPLLLLIIIAYWLTGNWLIIFKQLRLGKDEVVFTILKFRSLKKNNALSITNRMFALGTWLRKTSLDELPQLLNVIKGDMSLVGPRPLPKEYQPLFSDCQRKRFIVKPGITGLAQINGGAELPWQSKFKYDIEYLNNISFWKDLSILFQTTLMMLNKKKDGLDEKPFTSSLKHE